MTSKVPADRLPVAFMASFARSGETVVLRSLNAHRQIVALNQIVASDPADIAPTFRAVMAKDCAVVQVPESIRKPGATLLLVKHAVWTHRFSYRGFVLARNPFAVARSLKLYGVEKGESEDFRLARLRRWAAGIAPGLDGSGGSEIELLATLYLIKMKAALSAGHPVFRYEDIVADPEGKLRAIVGALNLEWDAGVMTSEKAYAVGDIGHGGIKLWLPIRSGGAPAYEGGLTDNEYQTVARVTHPVLADLGYRAVGRDVEVVLR